MEIKDNVLVKVTDDDINIDGAFEVPSYITEIGDYAFVGCKFLKKINIPNGVIRIGIGAFSDCYKLENITIPDSVTEIGVSAFSNCSFLKAITIPNNIKIIQENTFFRCLALRELNLPNNLIKIGDGAFHTCVNLIDIIIPNSVEIIGSQAFRNCSKLKHINFLSDTIYYIGDYAFYRCDSLENITVSDKFSMSIYMILLSLQSINLNLETSLLVDMMTLRTLLLETLTIYNTKVDLNNIKNDLRKIREEELQDKINSALLDNYIFDKKCFKLSEHRKFIDRIIDSIDSVSNYDYREDFNKYINDYVNQNKPKELVEVKNVQAMLTEIKGYELGNKELNDSTKIKKYGEELENYSLYIAKLLYELQTNSKSSIETINLKKVLTKLTKLEERNPEDLSKIIERTFFDVDNDGLVINKSAINQIISFLRYKVYDLKEEINGFEMLKEVIEVCQDKLQECKENVKNSEISDERDIRLLNIDNNSIKNNISEKMPLLEYNEIMMKTLYEQINNLIELNYLNISKLREIATIIIPSLLKNSTSNKVILKGREEVESLENICKTFKELLDIEESKANEIESLIPIEEDKGKVYKK